MRNRRWPRKKARFRSQDSRSPSNDLFTNFFSVVFHVPNSYQYVWLSVKSVTICASSIAAPPNAQLVPAIGIRRPSFRRCPIISV